MGYHYKIYSLYLFDTLFFAKRYEVVFRDIYLIEDSVAGKEGSERHILSSLFLVVGGRVVSAGQSKFQYYLPFILFS